MIKKYLFLLMFIFGQIFSSGSPKNLIGDTIKPWHEQAADERRKYRREMLLVGTFNCCLVAGVCYLSAKRIFFNPAPADPIVYFLPCIFGAVGCHNCYWAYCKLPKVHAELDKADKKNHDDAKKNLMHRD